VKVVKMLARDIIKDAITLCIDHGTDYDTLVNTIIMKLRDNNYMIVKINDGNSIGVKV